MFHQLRQHYHPFQKAALMFGVNYNIALDLLQQIKETKKHDNGFFRTYHQILFVPMDEFGVRLLRLVTSVNWREGLLSSLFEPEQYNYILGISPVRCVDRWDRNLLLFEWGCSESISFSGYDFNAKRGGVARQRN